LPLILAGFGLGSLSFSIWLVRYRLYFLAITFVLLGFAHWQHWRNPDKGGRWNRIMLYGATVTSAGLVGYALVTH